MGFNSAFKGLRTAHKTNAQCCLLLLVSPKSRVKIGLWRVQCVAGGMVQRVVGGMVQRVAGGMVQRVVGGMVQCVVGGMVQCAVGLGHLFVAGSLVLSLFVGHSCL